MLHERFRDGRIPGQYAADVSELVRYSESVIRAVAIKGFQLRGSVMSEAVNRLIALADALRVVRLSPQHCNVGRLKALELGHLVGIMESD